MNKVIYHIPLCLMLSFFFLFLMCASAISQGKAGNDTSMIGKTININTASVDDFDQVPLISRELAETIVKYREENGDFGVIEELLQVEGFTRELLRKVKNFLLLEGIGGDECTC